MITTKHQSTKQDITLSM